MKNKLRIAITAIFLLLAVAVFVGLNSMDKTTKTMEFIAGRMRGSTFVDYDQSIGVQSADDMGWWKLNGNWFVKYGKIVLEYTPEQLRDKEFLKLVSRIGIDIRGDLAAGELTFYWFDQELEELMPQ